MTDTPQIVKTGNFNAAAIHLIIPGRDMASYMDPAIAELLRVIMAQGGTPAGPLFSFHHRQPAETFDLEIGFPLTHVIKDRERVRMITFPAMTVVRAVYTGAYEGLGDAWGRLQEWVRQQGLAESGRFYESYLTNPDDEPDPRK